MADYGIDTPVRLDKQMAMGGGGFGNFGVAPLASTTRGGTTRGVNNLAGTGACNRLLKDSQRTASVSHSKGMGQGNPDHGDFS